MISRLSFWPVDAIRFSWHTRRKFGFVRALVFCVREMWHRASWAMVVEPLWALTVAMILTIAGFTALMIAVFAAWFVIGNLP